jgi:ATP-dependent helicase/nuclease subunit B
MSPESQRIRRHFLAWDRPLLPQAVAFLAEGWAGRTALDLSSLLVLVPTRQAGRRLREALAAGAAEHGQAVFPPRVLSLDALLADGTADAVATRVESLVAWAEVFQEISPDEFRAVFPVDPPERNFRWAVRLGGTFAWLQNTLAEVGLSLADVPRKVEPAFPELERWRQIAALGRRQEDKLAARGLRDAQAGKIARARTTEAPEGISRIVLVATADPRPVALTVLARLAESLPVEVLVFAPEAEAAAFDAWGRPQPEAWAQRDLELGDFEQQVHLCADPAMQARRVTEAAESYRQTEGMLGVGVVDPEILPLLESELRQAGMEGYNPEGRRHRGDRLDQLLRALAELARDDAFAAIARLARHPDILNWLRARCGAAFSAARFLEQLDHLQAEFLPADLEGALRHWKGGGELRHMRELRGALLRGAFPQNVAGVLAEIFAQRQFDLARPADAAAAEAAEAWTGAMREVARVMERFPGMQPQDGWELALQLYGETMRFADKPAGALELQGWLELVWEDAPHLIVAGLNDGRVPEAVTGDPFLPESLRARLGLKSNAMRFACDAYYLQALAASRARGGRIDLLLGKTSAAGEPLRPSRLLLRCADEMLPRRVEFLFGPVAAAGANLAWRRAWKLRPAPAAAPARVAVTALRAWLDCPFRFYLSRVRRMEAVDPAKMEMDALDFGILCHAALEAMGNAAALRDCTDARVLREFLLQSLEEAAAARYGRGLTLPLVVQLESARQRLTYAAEVQAQTRTEGWVIERVETKFELPVNGLTISGKIDRIDRHERTGAIRVLDYKTSDGPVNPAAAHLRNLGNEAGPDWAVFAGGGRPQAWTDLQLPLYERAVAGEFPDREIVCGYFNLPKAATETNIALWADYTRELAASAWACAEGVAGAIRAGEFWPPQERAGREAERDDFATLFHHGAAESVEWAERAAGEVPA